MTKRTRRGQGTTRDYPRTARLNHLFHEILAEELERIDDERVELVTVMSVEVDADVGRAVVYYESIEGEAADEEVLDVLDELRPRLQRAIARQARVRRTPELVFRPDDVSRGAARVEAVLRSIHDDDG